MKKLIITLSLLIPITLFSQAYPKDWVYSEVINVDSASTSQLFSNAKMFITDAFKSGKDVTQLVDESTYTIVGKGIIQPYVNVMFGMKKKVGNVNFTLKIQCKDGKYKYTISDFYFDNYIQGNSAVQCSLMDEKPCVSMLKSAWKNIKEYTDNDIQALIPRLKKRMSTTAAKDDF